MDYLWSIILGLRYEGSVRTEKAFKAVVTPGFFRGSRSECTGPRPNFRAHGYVILDRLRLEIARNLNPK